MSQTTVNTKLTRVWTQITDGTTTKTITVFDGDASLADSTAQLILQGTWFSGLLTRLKNININKFTFV